MKDIQFDAESWRIQVVKQAGRQLRENTRESIQRNLHFKLILGENKNAYSL
jgi:hypothetical protein